MALKKKFGCFWTLGLCLVATKSLKVPPYTDKNFIQASLDTHNHWRGMVDPPAANMKEMTWDKALAKLARSWGFACQFSHNPCSKKRYGCHEEFDFVGENLWIGDLNNFSPEIPIGQWYNESKNYHFENITCSGNCGHYTQLVWADSHKVGCAVTNCPNLGQSSTALFICNYGPAGNFLKVRPYTKGESCSLCQGDKCVKNLCPVNNGKPPQQITYHLLTLCFILQRIF